MSGKFTNTSYNDTVHSLLGAMNSAINNNYYKYSDKPPTPVEYFHLNNQASSLDEGSRLAFNNVGDDSPFRYNLIHNMMLYGIEQIQVPYTSEDFGVESQAIEGEAIILPNTIVPYPDDQFCITYLKKQIVFKVTHVDPDTLEDGSNIYKISYRSSTSKLGKLKMQVVDEYELIMNNVGTELNPILKSSALDFLKKLDEHLVSLKKFYKRIFYNKRVQTFTFQYRNDNFYDPYMIEFLKKNNILDGDGEYIYVQHQTPLEALFPMYYNKTMFACIENKDVVHVDQYEIMGAGKGITNEFTIFFNRMEPYWEVFYNYPEGYEILDMIPCFKRILIDHIIGEELIESTYTYYNIIIKYMHGVDIDENDIAQLDTMKFENSSLLYYAIPCIIYCLERYVNNILKVKYNTETSE